MVVASYIVHYFQWSLDQHPILKYFISTTKCMCHHTLSETKNDYPQLYVKKVRFCHQTNFCAKFMGLTFGCRAFGFWNWGWGIWNVSSSPFHSKLARSWQTCSCISRLARKESDLGWAWRTSGFVFLFQILVGKADNLEIESISIHSIFPAVLCTKSNKENTNSGKKRFRVFLCFVLFVC